MYNPAQNCRRPREEYEESNRAMVNTLAGVARRAHSSRAKLLVMGDFNHREIDWENLEPHGGPKTWRAKMLDVLLENTMHQHVKDTTRSNNMRVRRKCQPTTLRERVTFVHMWVGGKSLRAIALSSSVSVSTVFRWIHRWRQEGNVNTRRSKHKHLKENTTCSVSSSPSRYIQLPTNLMHYAPLQYWCEGNYLSHYSDWTIRHNILHPFSGKHKSSSVELLVKAVLTDQSQFSHSVFFFTDGTTSASTIFTIIDHLDIPAGVGTFEAEVSVLDVNKTDTQVSQVIPHARRIRQLSSYTTIVVISDELEFVGSFVKWSLKGRLAVWSTRLLTVTRLTLAHLQSYYTSLSKMNEMLLIITDSQAGLRCNMYVHLPFSPQETLPLRVGYWTPQRGLLLTSHLPLFPEKFSKFVHQPHLLAASEESPFHRMIITDDPVTPGKQIFHFGGPMGDLLDYLAEALNFSYSNVRPPDGVWGSKLGNGSWTGMMRMVMTEEVAIAVGPFMIRQDRAEVVDFTASIFVDYWRILGARGVPEEDPWGFIFPLEPLVWAAILAVMLVLATAIFLMNLWFSYKYIVQGIWLQVIFDYLRILLQQDLSVPVYWWWERILLVVWMMGTLVLTRSYSGNLMALLTVRHIAQPYQSRQQVLDDTSVTMIWMVGSGLEEVLQSAESGLYREMADAERTGRLIWRTQAQFPELMDSLVKQGDHVLIQVDNAMKALISQDFTRTGECSFYASKETFLPFVFGMIAPLDNPIIPALNKRIMLMTEAGLFFQWMKSADPNSTVCNHAPTKITVKTRLAMSNVWGMFVILIAGYAVGLSILCVEYLTANIKHI
ncbi:glutamate receptor-like [Cherax quadricarinatus]|uniref:glutamate receptor-like n=1 Tax=Cherax quadricarinatus TaxID=27406 RepID=UPI00387EBAAC